MPALNDESRSGAQAAAALSAGIAAVLAARRSGYQPGPLGVAVAATPYLVLPGIVATALAARRPGLLATAAAATAAALATQLPHFRGHTVSGSEWRMGTVNLLLGAADAQQVAQWVREEGIDVLSVQELTEDARARLSAAGLDALLPHQYTHPAPAWAGTGLWSRWPLTGTRAIPGTRSANLLAEIQIPGVGSTTVAALHPAAPKPWTNRSVRQDYAILDAELSTLTGRVAAAGDLNATLDQAPLRGLLRRGFRDAASECGAGLALTWPSRKYSPVRLFSLDHVLLRGALAARSVRISAIAGSDHAAVVADIVALS